MRWKKINDFLSCMASRLRKSLFVKKGHGDTEGPRSAGLHGPNHLKSGLDLGHRLKRSSLGFCTSEQGPKNAQLESKLNSLFDSLRAETDEKNKMELDSTMDYLGNKLGISLENAELFVVLELVKAPSVGEIERKGFVEGWKAAGVDADHQEQAAYIRSLVSSLSTDQALFKKVYKHTFVAGREGDQKALGLENAVIYWGMLFSPPGMSWKTKNHDWWQLWKTFLGEKWTRSVNKDMWNMALEFAQKSLADETLSFWSEDGAWPSVIDDFVEWCREKGIAKVEAMDVDH